MQTCGISFISLLTHFWAGKLDSRKTRKNFTGWDLSLYPEQPSLQSVSRTTVNKELCVLFHSMSLIIHSIVVE
jgi:hypothetical protein